jgi:hypothetical protein
MRQRPIESVEVVLGNCAVKIVYTPAARVASCSGRMARRRHVPVRAPDACCPRLKLDGQQWRLFIVIVALATAGGGRPCV